MLGSRRKNMGESSPCPHDCDASRLVSSTSHLRTVVFLISTQPVRLDCSRTHHGSLWPQNLVLSTSCLCTNVVLISTQPIRLVCSRTHHGSLRPLHYLQTPLRGWSRPAVLLMWSPPGPTLELLLPSHSFHCRPQLPPSHGHFCLVAVAGVITSASWAAYSSLEPWPPTNLLLAVPIGISLSRLWLPCKAACQEKRGGGGRFGLITASFRTSKPGHREELEPGIPNFPAGLLKLLTKWAEFGINHWKTRAINPWVPEIVTPWSSSQLRLSKPRTVPFLTVYEVYLWPVGRCWQENEIGLFLV